MRTSLRSTAPATGPNASRRSFLSAATLPFLTGRAGSATANSPRTLIVVNQRGGSDNMSICGPYTDSAYVAARPTLRVPTTGPNAATLLPNTGNYFYLSKAGASLLPAYNARELAFVNAVGVPGQTKSHFDAMYALETANDPQNVNPQQTTGWAGRWRAPPSSRGWGVRGTG